MVPGRCCLVSFSVVACTDEVVCFSSCCVGYYSGVYVACAWPADDARLRAAWSRKAVCGLWCLGCCRIFWAEGGDRHRSFWFVGLIEVRFFGFVFGRRFGDARGWCSVLHACSSYRLKSITFAWYGEQSTQGVCICMYQYH